MDALILAAGLGSRLQSDRPKPLTVVAGEALIDRTIGGLRRAGIARIVVVVGHEAAAVRAHLSEHWPNVETVYNPDFATKGNGVSAAVARELMPEQFILTMADHIVEDAIWQLAVAQEPRWDGIILLVDRRIKQVFDLADATKVLVGKNGRMDKIGKELERYNAIDTGVFVCSPMIFSGIEAELATTGDASLSDGVRTVIQCDTAETVDIGDSFWQDVDTPEMLAHASARLAN
ncbi:MAG: choline kinase [Bradymonadia bacterium]|jgi:choline kinase